MNEAIKFIFIGIDVLTLVCMIFYLIRGFKKGVIKSVIDVVVKLILLILSFVIAKPLATKLVGSKISFITGDQTVNEFVKTQLDTMDINQSVDVLQKQVYDLQQNLKYLQQSGLPLYPSQGATVDLWQRSLERIQ